MNEILEDAAIVLVIAAALIMSLMILAVIGTVVLNASLSWGWAALAAGIVVAVWAVLKVPIPQNTDAPPTQER